jgi:hypothetical protein
VATTIDFDLFDMENQDKSIRDFLDGQDQEFVIDIKVIAGIAWQEKNVVSTDRNTCTYLFEAGSERCLIDTGNQQLIGSWNTLINQQYLELTIPDFFGRLHALKYKIRFQSESILIFENQDLSTRNQSQFLVLAKSTDYDKEATLSDILEDLQASTEQSPISFILVFVIGLILLVLLILLYSTR